MVESTLPDREQDLHTLPILTTKLYRPPVGPDLEPRASILNRLRQNSARPLTLISAPAGYGKTTLASMWVEASGWRSAWVSLDEGDNDLRTFAGYLVAALGRALPEAKFRTQDLLEAPGPLLPAVLARYLMSDLEQIEEPFILTLDDLYTIRERAVFDLLNQLLRHPMPMMHLLLITRRDPPLPIASLRGRRQVTEVRARDLRFTVGEAKRLLSTMLQREVDEETAAELTQRTEGWVTALQLAALSLRHRGWGTEGIRADNRYLQEYLLAEVLASLPPDRQEWLLALPVVERFCAPLAEELCREAAGGSDGEEIIAWLREENLFLIPLDDEQVWFRFHHLFQDLLRARLYRRLSADKIAVLHLRVSRWYAENNSIGEAIRHAVTGGDVANAVELVVQHRYEAMNAGQWNLLQSWHQLLPVEAVAQSPHLLCDKVALALNAHSQQASEIMACIQAAEDSLNELSPDSRTHQVLSGETAVARSLVEVALGELTSARANALEGLRVLPAEAALIRTLAHVVIATSLQMQGDYRSAVDMVNDAQQDSSLPSNVQAYVLHWLFIVQFMEGDLHGVLVSGRQCLRIAERLGTPWPIGYARHDLGVTHYLRNEFEEAEPFLRAMFADRAASPPTYVACATVALALICVSRGSWSEAEQLIATASAQFSEINDRAAITIVEAFRVELALRSGDLPMAQSLSTSVMFDMRPPLWFFYVPQLTPIKLLWAEDTAESLAKARTALEGLDERMAAVHRNSVRIDVLSLLALVCAAQRETATAFDKLTEALKLAEPGGFIRNFVDLGPPMADLLVRFQRRNQLSTPKMQRHLERILAAFSSRVRDAGWLTGTAQAESASVEPLTPRELEILRLLATDRSPREIAGRLVLSVSTVRTHIKNIYAKLGVHSRVAAVRRARELHIR